MVASINRETEEMTRAFKDFVSDMGATMRNMTPTSVKDKVEQYTEALSSVSSARRTTSGGGGGGGGRSAASPRDLFDSLHCGALPGLECSSLGRDDPDTTPVDWTSSSPSSPSTRRRKKTGSDWSVQVYDGTESVVYHVHTVVLSYGPRSSQYFTKLFEKKRMAGMAAAAASSSGALSPTPSLSSKRGRGEAGGGGSKAGQDGSVATEVYLPPPSAAAFPALLNYIYHDRLDLSTSNAPALRHLSKHFSVQSLFERVGSFVRKDLSAQTAPDYAIGADAVMDKDLLDAALRKCAEHLTKGLRVERLPPKLMGELVSSRHVTSGPGRCSPEVLSEAVCRYIRGRNERLGDESFYWLTQPRVLPSVSPSEAIFLLSFGQKFPAVLHEGGEASLKKRCMDALEKDWSGGLGDAVESSCAAVGQGSEAREKGRGTSPSPAGVYSPVAGGGDGVEDNGDLRRARDTATRYKNLPLELKVELLEMALLSARREQRRGIGGMEGSRTTHARSSKAQTRMGGGGLELMGGGHL